MKFSNLIAAMLICGSVAYAQGDDPVVMKINGVPVTRSEFEYSYNKNNTEDVIDRKSVEDYVDLFINYKLKVAAAYDAKLDTLSSFKKEFASICTPLAGAVMLAYQLLLPSFEPVSRMSMMVV